MPAYNYYPAANVPGYQRNNMRSVSGPPSSSYSAYAQPIRPRSSGESVAFSSQMDKVDRAMQKLIDHGVYPAPTYHQQQPTQQQHYLTSPVPMASSVGSNIESASGSGSGSGSPSSSLSSSGYTIRTKKSPQVTFDPFAPVMTSGSTSPGDVRNSRFACGLFENQKSGYYQQQQKRSVSSQVWTFGTAASVWG